MEQALQNYKSKSLTDTMKEESARVVEKYDAFGFPWTVVTRADGEEASFWGCDRFENMAWWYVLANLTLNVYRAHLQEGLAQNIRGLVQFLPNRHYKSAFNQFTSSLSKRDRR
jgi:hypothetical protein